MLFMFPCMLNVCQKFIIQFAFQSNFHETTYHPEGNFLGYTQSFALLETHIIVDVNDIATCEFHENIIEMSIAESDCIACMT
jgi:hypothetical protein